MRRCGFSLLEVIIATAILVGASMTLLRLLSIGQQHQVRAEKRAVAQSLCQTLIDERVAGIQEIRRVDRETFPDRTDWEFSIDPQPTEIAGVVRVRVQVWRMEQPDARVSRNDRDRRADFELVRWMRRSDGGRR